MEYGEMNGVSSVGRRQRFTVMIEREGNGYVSLCPELDIASQGESVEGKKLNANFVVPKDRDFSIVSILRSHLESGQLG